VKVTNFPIANPRAMANCKNRSPIRPGWLGCLIVAVEFHRPSRIEFARPVVRICLLLGCLLISTPAVAGPFDVSPTFLEKQVNEAVATLKLPPLTDKDTHPQDCGDAGSAFKICNKTVYGVTLGAFGHEFPPKIEHVQVIFLSKDPPTVQLGVIIALLIYDPAVIVNDRKDLVQPVLDALFKGSENPVSLEGLNAKYVNIRQFHGNWTMTIDPRK
jgi:hypothetical protein